MWRFLDSGFADCYTNMAIDEAMLIEYSSGSTPPTLRIYGWYPPAFSLGYFQDPTQELDIEKCRRENISFVRRITGGGVIFHHQELTYSLVCSRDDISTFGSLSPASAHRIGVKETFKIICSFLINAYNSLGLEARFALGETSRQKNGWFCFATREKYDIIIKGKKLGGNAQRRKKDIIFQHGSIPLKLDIDKASSFLRKKPHDIKDNICSLEEVLGSEITFLKLKSVIKKSFEKNFLATLSEEGLTYNEIELYKELRTEKYKTPDWNLFKDAYSNQKAKVA